MSSDTKVDPWALLREARESLDSYQSDDHAADANTWWGRRWEKAQHIMSRIDAALAAHEAEERVEWEEGTDYEKTPWYEAWIGHIGLHIRRWPWRSHKEPEVFYWHVWSPLDEDGQAATLDEAKAAAIAAARGMR